MEIRQFQDVNLAHYSYAVVSGNEMAVIDPSRDPAPYYEFAKQKQARLTAIIETHPHADFVSSHAEMARHTGASVYVSKLLGATYPHRPFDEGDTVTVGKVTLKALNTPGHSPDSITIVVIDETGRPHAVFTGDTLFIGDCGRPDLREKAGAITSARTDLARNMYHSLRHKLMTLPDDVRVYPAHGAGSLCGKALSSAHMSTIGAEKKSNWSLQPMSEEAFVQELLHAQPFVPKYFPYDVEINRSGAEDFGQSIARVPRLQPVRTAADRNALPGDTLIIDTRAADQFRKGHLRGAINLMNGKTFETWLGSLVAPREPFFLVVQSMQEGEELIRRIAKIGYETQIAGVFESSYAEVTESPLTLDAFQAKPSDFTVVDVRNDSEVAQGLIFDHALTIPLHQLRERVDEIPSDKSIVVHCAAGYRSAAGASIIRARKGDVVQVFDLGENVRAFAMPVAK